MRIQDSRSLPGTYLPRITRAACTLDFITVLWVRFSYKFFAKAKTYLEKAAETTFVRKIRT